MFDYNHRKNSFTEKREGIKQKNVSFRKSFYEFVTANIPFTLPATNEAELNTIAKDMDIKHDKIYSPFNKTYFVPLIFKKGVIFL